MATKTIKNFEEFKSTLEKSADLQRRFQTDPVQAIQQFKQSPVDTDSWIYRIVVLSKGLAILTIIVGVIILTANKSVTYDKSMPIFTTLGWQLLVH